MLLYHYCAFDKFESILKSKSLWLTQLTNSNDTEEVLRTFKIIWERIKNEIEKGIENIDHYKEIMQRLDEQMQTDAYVSIYGREIPYGICLSTNRDLAQNWNEYGDNSKGVALGFSGDFLKGIKNDLPHPSSVFENAIGWNHVYYDTIEISDQFIKMFINMLSEYDNPLAWLNVRTTLKHYSAFIKNPTFCDEREVRIVYYPHDGHKDKTNSGISSLTETPIPHCSLPWIKDNGICTLKEIIIGTNCPYDENHIKELLNKYGIQYDISIVRSDYSYRISPNR